MKPAFFRCPSSCTPARRLLRSMACRSDGPGEHTEFRSPVECTTSEFISDIYLWSNAGRLRLTSSFSPTVSIESSTRWAYSCSRPARSEKSVRRTGLSSAESKSFLDREGITAPHPLFKVATQTLRRRSRSSRERSAIRKILGGTKC